MIEKLNIKHGIPMDEVWKQIISKINELINIVNQLQYNTMNPIDILWDLNQTPEEERGKQAALWDYLEEEVDENGETKINS